MANSNKVNLTIKDLIRQFFIYPITGFPVIDNTGNFIGIIKNNDVVKYSSDVSRLTDSLESFITHNITKPDEPTILNFISEVGNLSKFPVLNFRGEVSGYWSKKDIIGLIYKSSRDLKLDYGMILDFIPQVFVATDIDDKIVFASSGFLKEFEFNSDFLIGQKVSKFFPKILCKPGKQDLNSKEHRIVYQHRDWNYKIIPISSSGSTEMGHIYFFNEPQAFESNEHVNYNMSLSDFVEFQERIFIKRVLDLHEWNINKASKQLKITSRILQYKILKHKLTPPIKK